jgi:hypothetical protein
MKKTLLSIALAGVALTSVFPAIPAMAQDAPPAAEEQAAPLVIANMSSLPPVIPAAGGVRACEYDYYFDAAHTQWAGYCQGACYAGGGWCTGTITDYSVRLACVPCACGYNGGEC